MVQAMRQNNARAALYGNGLSLCRRGEGMDVLKKWRLGGITDCACDTW